MFVARQGARTIVPRVLVLCEYPTRWGGEQSLLSTIPGLRAAGWELEVACPPAGPLAEALRALHVPLHAWTPAPQTGPRPSQTELRAALRELLTKQPLDLLHANSLAMGRLSGPVARDLRIRSLAHLRDIVTCSAQARDDLACHSRLLAVSEATRSFHLQHGLPAGLLYVNYNGVDLDEFRPRPPTGWLHRELRLPADAQLLGMIGQLGPRKGPDLLVRAAAQAASAHPRWHLVFCGERTSGKAESRQFEATLHGDLAAAGLAERSHFLGFRRDLSEVLPELTVLVHPARQEPLGRVLLEGAACGLPVICTDVGGNREIFGSECAFPAALFIPPCDPSALAAALVKVTSDANLQAELGLRARARAVDRFGLTAAVASLDRHYREVAQGRCER